MSSVQGFMNGEDRYTALGVPYPDPLTMCNGQCEGTGIYPQFLAGPWLKAGSTRLMQEEHVTEEEVTRWHAVHLAADHGETNCDGWHFITCPDCEGSGKRGGN